jgi:hypothetical protein
LGAFGGFEVAATLLGIVGAVVLIARLQGKGDWAIGNVARDLRGAIVRVLSHLLLPQRILDRRRGILALMALAGLTAIVFPPFMSEIDNRVYRQAEFDGYAFLFTPPSQANRYASVHIDYGRLGLEFVAIFLTGGLILLLLGSQERRTVETSPADEAVGELLQSVVAGFRAPRLRCRKSALRPKNCWLPGTDYSRCALTPAGSPCGRSSRPDGRAVEPVLFMSAVRIAANEQ